MSQSRYNLVLQKKKKEKEKRTKKYDFNVILLQHFFPHANINFGITVVIACQVKLVRHFFSWSGQINYCSLQPTIFRVFVKSVVWRNSQTLVSNYEPFCLRNNFS